MKENHDIDNLFKNAFENFEAEPPLGAWEGIVDGLFDQELLNAFDSFEATPELPFESIASNIDRPVDALTDAEFDSAVKQKLNKLEREPSESVWQKVKVALPLNLLLKQSLTQLSKIAAILLIGLSIVFTMGYFGVIDKIQDYFYVEPPVSEEELAIFKEESADGTLLYVEEDEPSASDNLQPSVGEKGTAITTEQSGIGNLESEISSQILENSETQPSKEPSEMAVKSPRTIDVELSTTNRQLSIEQTGISTEQSEIGNLKSEVSGQVLETNEAQLLTDPSAIAEESFETFDAQQSAETTAKRNEPSASDIQQTEDDQPLSNHQFRKTLQSTTVLPSLAAFDNSIIAFIPIQGDEYANMEHTNKERGNFLSRKMDNLQILDALTFRGWYFNFYAQVNNTWLLNNDIRDLVSTGSGRAEYVLDIGAAYGAGLGYQITPRLAIEGNWLHVRHGQRYQEFTEAGVYKTTELNSTYNYFPIWAKIQAARMQNSGGNALTWNYKVGLHYGRLDGAVLKTGNEAVAFTEHLIENEIGLDLGLEMRLFLDPRFFVSVGAHGSYGVDVSTLSGSPVTNASNLNLGLQLGIHYRIRR